MINAVENNIKASLLSLYICRIHFPYRRWNQVVQTLPWGGKVIEGALQQWPQHSKMRSNNKYPRVKRLEFDIFFQGLRLCKNRWVRWYLGNLRPTEKLVRVTNLQKAIQRDWTIYSFSLVPIFFNLIGHTINLSRN